MKRHLSNTKFDDGVGDGHRLYGLTRSSSTNATHLVNKKVIATGVWGDEAEPLGGVEPDSATCVSANSRSQGRLPSKVKTDARSLFVEGQSCKD